MHALVAPAESLDPVESKVALAQVSLGTLRPGASGTILRVGADIVSPRERRLIELGFVRGEPFKVLAQTRPGGDPFVIRVGDTTLAVRRHEVETVWVDLSSPTPRP